MFEPEYLKTQTDTENEKSYEYSSLDEDIPNVIVLLRYTCSCKDLDAAT